MSESSDINNIVLLLHPDMSVDTLQADIAAYLRVTAPELKVFYRSPKQMIESMQAQSNIFTIGRWDRGHEYYASVCNRATSRNWYTQSHRC